jgi:hypothetical protein
VAGHRSKCIKLNYIVSFTVKNQQHWVWYNWSTPGLPTIFFIRWAGGPPMFLQDCQVYAGFDAVAGAVRVLARPCLVFFSFPRLTWGSINEHWVTRYDMVYTGSGSNHFMVRRRARTLPVSLLCFAVGHEWDTIFGLLR